MDQEVPPHLKLRVLERKNFELFSIALASPLIFNRDM